MLFARMINRYWWLLLHSCVICCLFSEHSCAQSLASLGGLFESEEVLTIRISGNMRALLKDRKGESVYQSFTLSYTTNDSSRVSIPLRIKQRGHFRRTMGNCSYPPLLLNFSKEDIPSSSLFHQQNKVKLVTPCQGEKYVIREYLVYKLYNLISLKSFKARLVKVIYEDTERGKISDPLYGILLEEEEQMAKRNQASLVEGKLFRPQQTRQDDFLKMAVFQYLIGNTDWSIQYYQNIKLITVPDNNTPIPIPYDFDHSGIVGAPYAHPAPELMLQSTRERRYRGYCLSDLTMLDSSFAEFQKLKNQIYGLYAGNSLLEPSYVKATLKFLDTFYETIKSPKDVKSEFSYPCRQDDSANVVIQGLKKK